MSDRKVSPDEATQMFLDYMKRANPSAEVRAVIVEVEDEIKQKKESRPTKRKRELATSQP